MPVKVIFICLFFFAGNVLAIDVKTLYNADVIAGSQSREDRNTAIREALELVLQRILDSNEFQREAFVRSLLADASAYVRQYRYLQVAGNTEANGSSRRMLVEFDGEALLKELKGNRLSVWGADRKAVLIWLVIEEKGKQQLFNAEIMPELYSSLLSAATAKGLPLLFPLMDLQEQQMISVDDILSQDRLRLEDISRRYAVDVIMSAKIVIKGKCQSADWRLFFAGNEKHWMQKCSKSENTLIKGMQEVYDSLFNYYAAKTLQAPKSVVLKVSGIHGVNDMLRVKKYLNSLSLINSISELRVEAGYYSYTINFNSDWREINRVFQQDKVLQVLGDSTQGTGILEYRYLPESTVE